MSDISSFTLRPSLPRTPEAITAELAEMSTPGYNWDMLRAAGNAACSAALGRIVTQLPDLTPATLVEVFDAELEALWDAGYRDVGDSEPLAVFTRAANLICALRDWRPVDKYDLGTRLGEAEKLLRAQRKEAEAEATRQLIGRHRVEWEALAAAVLNS